MLVPAEGGELTPLVAGRAGERDGAVSPDGRWLAYTSDETGVAEVYVIPFAPAWPGLTIDPESPSPRWRVSIAGGDGPVWGVDGTELYYGAQSGSIISVQADITGEVFRSDSGTPLFQASWEPGSTFQVLKDGQRFFLNDLTQIREEPLSVVLNWQGLLKRRGDTVRRCTRQSFGVAPRPSESAGGGPAQPCHKDSERAPSAQSGRRHTE